MKSRILTQVTTVLVFAFAAVGAAYGFLTAQSAPDNAPPQFRNIRSDGHNAETQAYLLDLEQKIKRAWVPTEGENRQSICVYFKLHRNGKLTELKAVQPFGPYDPAAQPHLQEAIQAVERSAPFKKLPASAPSEIEVVLSFNYEDFSLRPLP